MLEAILLGLAMALVIEGLVLALAPLRFEQILEMLREMSLQARRNLGLAIIAGGVVLVWVAKTFF